MYTHAAFQQHCTEKFQGDTGLPALLGFLGGWDAALVAAASKPAPQMDDALRVHFLMLAAPAICAQLFLDMMRVPAP